MKTLASGSAIDDQEFGQIFGGGMKKILDAPRKLHIGDGAMMDFTYREFDKVQAFVNDIMKYNGDLLDLIDRFRKLNGTVTPMMAPPVAPKVEINGVSVVVRPLHKIRVRSVAGVLQQREEAWVKLPEYPDYEVSDRGNFRHSFHKSPLKIIENKNLPYVYFNKVPVGTSKMKNAAFIVASLFLPKHGPVLHFLDQDRMNIHPFNMIWITQNDPRRCTNDLVPRGYSRKFESNAA